MSSNRSEAEPVQVIPYGSLSNGQRRALLIVGALNIVSFLLYLELGGTDNGLPIVLTALCTLFPMIFFEARAFLAQRLELNKQAATALVVLNILVFFLLEARNIYETDLAYQAYVPEARTFLMLGIGVIFSVAYLVLAADRKVWDEDAPSKRSRGASGKLKHIAAFFLANLMALLVHFAFASSVLNIEFSEYYLLMDSYRDTAILSAVYALLAIAAFYIVYRFVFRTIDPVRAIPYFVVISIVGLAVSRWDWYVAFEENGIGFRAASPYVNFATMTDAIASIVFIASIFVLFRRRFASERAQSS